MPPGCPEPGHCQPDSVMSQDIGDTRTHGIVGSGVVISGFVAGSRWWGDAELAEDFAGGGVDDADREVPIQVSTKVLNTWIVMRFQIVPKLHAVFDPQRAVEPDRRSRCAGD